MQVQSKLESVGLKSSIRYGHFTVIRKLDVAAAVQGSTGALGFRSGMLCHCL